MCLAQGPQRSDAGEARGPSVSSKALTTEPLRSPLRRFGTSCVHTVLQYRVKSGNFGHKVNSDIH